LKNSIFFHNNYKKKKRGTFKKPFYLIKNSKPEITASGSHDIFTQEKRLVPYVSDTQLERWAWSRI